MQERYFKFSTGEMAYYIIGTGKPIVILHGWGQSFFSFKSIVDELKNEYQIIGIDFLGFGLSDEPSNPLKICDYSFQVKTLLGFLEIENPIIIGHSFGGRIAIDYAADLPVEKLILVSSAGIKHWSLKRSIKVLKYKLLKNTYKIFSKKKLEALRSKSGSRDYLNASPVMKKTLSNIIKYSSKSDLKKVKSKTYLLWGIKDEETKYSDALIMKNLLKNSVIIPFYESGHFCYLEEKDKFIRELKNILKEK